ncbi:(d)CMP kinase [Buchnera aphidicola (Hyadaphis tataricae)]|uniref:Cytidylate kinase n=1 Tax=Buchnera aphidicola (Hyadaphis tataricae) TaxID=1241859 RepID=A0A4D6XZL4_9GAMM|nr:(d)CMP kinase [Buchnera aphidicola]QCI21609.1 (d)CMP kinase [Buchnera aphidicola (Hyadaphis tataricae)]
MKKKIPVITIDGPSGVGKSTLSKIIATKLRWKLLESGKIYRYLAYFAMSNNITINEKNIVFFIKNLDELLKHNKDTDQVINNEKISTISSQLSIFPKIRELLLNKQRSFRSFPGLIAEGRDMGTVIFPDADVKFFLNADLNVRVTRRILELQQKGFFISFKELFVKMYDRDQQDQNRLFSPLCIPKNAIILNSTNMSLSEVVKYSMQYIMKKIK